MEKGYIVSTTRLKNTNGVLHLGLLSRQNSDGTIVFNRRYLPTGGPTAELDFAQVREVPGSDSELIIAGNLNNATGRYGAFVIDTDVDGVVLWANEYRDTLATISLAADGFDFAPNGDVLLGGRRGTAVPSRSLRPTAL